MAYVKQKSIKTTVLKNIVYIENKDKTEDKFLVSSYKCSTDERLAYKEFYLLKKKYDKEGGILAHHFMQSFKPGEVDPETAHKIGKEWAEKFLDGNYQFILTTHTDKDHIHNHITANSVGLNGKKFNTCRNELKDIRKYSDLVCREHELSIIEPNKRNKNKSYKEWKESNNKTSWKDVVREDIDAAISCSDSYEEFLKNMQDQNYYIKQGNVKYITFKKQGMSKSVRGKTLGLDYDEHSIKQRIKFKEHNIGSFKSKDKKYYRIDKNSLEYQMKRLSYRHGTLETNVKLIILLLKMIFNNNQNSFIKNDRPVKYTYAQKKAIKGIEDLSTKLNLLNKYNLHKRGDVQNQIEILDNKIRQEEMKLQKLKLLEIKMDAVCTEIELYHKYKKYNDEYKQSFLKGAYKKQHEYELEKFERCKERLEKFGLKDEAQYDDFINQREDIIEKIKGVEKRINNISNVLTDIEDLQQYLNKNERNKFIEDIQLETNIKDEKEKER
ncbi:hypothetical protein J2Z76_002585 [Sedimentibacter acidaminivorans]|uniref:MobA/VirD2-like nuclease domain-containing protein n=1 Tax=Sedimentibacter acidaminivorans TaxID=913099 RepID=A0ABS4GH48_9FIRM|nr:relaxase/mobilization nuclease domain-containing protein [Sedimentibacter acidaminivorans]MBP1926715.1 hypothetical protein [Sedimentibacter acidaminivorans]